MFVAAACGVCACGCDAWSCLFPFDWRRSLLWADEERDDAASYGGGGSMRGIVGAGVALAGGD